MKRDAFSRCHPLVNFLFFSLVLVFHMFFFHPGILLISLAVSVLLHPVINKLCGLLLARKETV